MNSHFWGGHSSAQCPVPNCDSWCLGKDRRSTQCFYYRMLFQPPVIVISVFRGRRGSFGFNCPQETFFQGIYFFPTLTLWLSSDYNTETNLTAYYQEHHPQWRSWNDFFLAQVSSPLSVASSFQILLFEGKVEKSGWTPQESKRNAKEL